MMVPSKVEKLLDLSNFSYVLVNAWQFLAMLNNALQYLVMLDCTSCVVLGMESHTRDHGMNSHSFLLHSNVKSPEHCVSLVGSETLGLSLRTGL